MNDELVNTALEWERKWCMPDYTAADNYCAILADAVRSLRETVKAKDEEIARLKSQLDDIGKWHAVNPSLDQALNENDGVYKP